MQWGDEFANGMKDSTEQWARELEQSARDGPLTDDAAQHSRKITNVLAADPEGRFSKSKFLQFVSKMSQGDRSFLGTSAPTPADLSATADAWSTQFETENNATAAGYIGTSSLMDGNRSGAWATQFAQQNSAPTADGVINANTGLQESWADDFNSVMQQQAVFEDAWSDIGIANDDAWRSASQQSAHAQPTTTEAYRMHENNPYDGNVAAMQIARELFAQGSLSEAVLALEAVVKLEEGDVAAWKLLGTAHAENDDDRQAIAAMRRALAAEPNNLDVLLALGVSHVNELQEGQAVDYLLQCVTTTSASFFEIK